MAPQFLKKKPAAAGPSRQPAAKTAKQGEQPLARKVGRPRGSKTSGEQPLARTVGRPRGSKISGEQPIAKKVGRPRAAAVQQPRASKTARQQGVSSQSSDGQTAQVANVCLEYFQQIEGSMHQREDRIRADLEAQLEHLEDDMNREKQKLIEQLMAEQEMRARAEGRWETLFQVPMITDTQEDNFSTDDHEDVLMGALDTPLQARVAASPKAVRCR